MDSPKNEWTKQAVIRLIELYKENDCLYSPKNGLYHNKHARYTALYNIAEGLQDIMPYISTNDVKVKITALRGQYAKTLQKIRERKGDSSMDDDFEPTAYWFKQLQFLKDYMSVRKLGNYNFPSSADPLSFEHFADDLTGSSVKAKRKRIESPCASICSVSDEGPECFSGTANKILNATSTISANQTGETKAGENKDFCNFLKSQMDKITNEDVKDDLIEQITLLLFEAKKRQKLLNSNEHNKE